VREDAVPIQTGNNALPMDKKLRVILARAISSRQRLILSEIDKNSGTATGLIRTLSEKYDIPESTLRRDVKILRGLGLLACGNSENKGASAVLTDLGKKIRRCLNG